MSSKNRPNWRVPLIDVSERKHLNIKPPNPRADGLRVGPRCKARTRAGNPCQLPAMTGAPTCHKHGGHRHALRSEQERLGEERVVSFRSGIGGERKRLARLSTQEPMPIGVDVPLSPVDRGALIEAYQNRELDPETWLDLTRGRKQ